MQGASPLASPAFNRLRHLQTFSNMNPAEGLPGWSPANLTAAVPAGGACLPCRLPTLPFAFFLPPIPPPPFPDGEGGEQGYFMQGAEPLASPAFNRLRHLQSLPYRYPHGVAGFFTTRIPDAQREPTLLQSKEPAPSGHRLRSTSQCRPGSALGDARGEAPCIRKQKISPFPGGEGAGGWGRQSKLKAGRAGGKEGKPPRRGQRGQVEPSARRQMRKLSKQPQQQHLELHWLGNFTPQSFLRKILKTSCNLRRIVV